MASMRNPGEADEIHSQSGLMIWVDADPKLRYDRVQMNISKRGRESEDKVSYEQFLADEAAEMHRPAGGDGATLSMADVKSRCDIFLTNDGDSLDELDAKLIRELGL